jgi:hypothetical protein
MSDAYLNAPVKLTVLPREDGWEGVIVIPYDGAEVFIRLPGEKEFHSTGFTKNNNTATGKPLPKTNVPLNGVNTKGTISIKYVDTQGHERGPFDTAFDPVVEFVNFAKRIMPKDVHELAPVHHWKNKRMVTLAQLLMFRAAITKLTVGPDPKDLSRVLQLPPPQKSFTMSEVSAEDALITQDVPAEWKNVYLRVDYADGTSSEPLMLE